jgi:hypothetical protein
MTFEYHAVSRWRVTGTARDVADVLADTESLPRWWPAVYLSADVTAEGNPDGVGRTVRMHTKGWLPYSLRWSSTLLEPVGEGGFALTAAGDLNGSGRWTFTQSGPDVFITFDWRVTAEKPLLRRLGWLLKPAFAANHRWAMRQGERSLRLELSRRAAGSSAAAARVPAPPGPTFSFLVRP